MRLLLPFIIAVILTFLHQAHATPTWNLFAQNQLCTLTSSTWDGTASTTQDCQATCQTKGLMYAIRGLYSNCGCGANVFLCTYGPGINVYQLASVSGSWSVDATNTDCATTSAWLGVQSASACQASCSSFFYAIQGADNNCKCADTLSTCTSTSGSTVYSRAPATPAWSNYLSNTDCLPTATWLGVMSTAACESTCAGNGLGYAVQGADGNCKCGGAPTGCQTSTGFNVYQLTPLIGAGNWEVVATNTDCATTSSWLGIQSASACQASCSSFFYAIQGADNNCKCASTLSTCNSSSGVTVYARPT